MGYTLWTFVLLPDGTIARYPRARFDDFYDGRAPLGIDVEGEAKFVEVAIETRRGHPLRMVRAWFYRYRLEPGGFVSLDHRERMLRDAISAMDAGLARDQEEKVVSLEPFIARRRSSQEHAWQPDELQLYAIVAAINYDAAKDLVATDGKTLVPT